MGSIGFKINTLSKYKDIIKFFYFPFLFLWLELWVHIFDKTLLRYAVIYSLFSLSWGFLIGIPVFLIKNHRISKVYAVALSGIISVIYAAEYIAHAILQTYYPTSSLKTAAGNHLTDFKGAVFETIYGHIIQLVIFLIPFIFICIFARRIFIRDLRNKNLQAVVSSLVLMVLFHILGFLALYLPWKGDLKPKNLYRSDQYYNDQFEQLGLHNMLRLDIFHQIFPSAVKPLSPDILDFPQRDLSDDENPKDNKYKKNVMNIDFQYLGENTDNESIKWLCRYFDTVEPTYKNKYTGMFKDYNVIFITVEAFDYLGVDKARTPTLYKLMNEGFVFKNFYSPLHFTSTSNGECQNLLGLYPKNGEPITMSRTGELKTNLYFSLAQQLNRLGYDSLGYHNNWNLYERDLSHPNLGYRWNWSGHGMNYQLKPNGDPYWPQRDTFLVENSADTFINSDRPFNIYYLTVSGHTPYVWNWVASQHKDLFRDSPYSDTTNAYLATVVEFDKMMELLLEKLDEAGKLENTLIVAAPDHVPYSNIGSISELSGKDLGNVEAAQSLNERLLDPDVYKNGMIIWSASMKEPVVIDKVSCPVDILPTLSNLLGLEYDSRMLAGRDLLSDEEGLVIFSSRSWKSDRGFYNRYTGEFTPADGVKMSKDEMDRYVENMKTAVSCRLDMTDMIVENNFYDYVFGPEGKSTGSIGGKMPGIPYEAPETDNVE